MIDVPTSRAPYRRAVVARRRLRASAVALLLATGLVACAEPPSVPGAGRVPAPASSGTAPTGGEAAAPDPCTLLTAAEVTEVIGEHGGPRPGTDGCGWENPETYHSITLSIGRTGTAVDGNLPTPDPILGTPEPGPDGIRFVRTGAAEFAVGDRYCELTVVTSVTDDRDRPTLVRLVGLVRTRL
ncbi:hypothetical protein [Micromonospora fluostatini]|uniref:hypothetical protein n=1 Tax=Micromonospora sp. JCM 30529 TaxID=3421643 RepID=UPI003D174D26